MVADSVIGVEFEETLVQPTAMGLLRRAGCEARTIDVVLNLRVMLERHKRVSVGRSEVEPSKHHRYYEEAI